MRSYGVAIIFNGQSYGLMSQDIKDNTNMISAFRTLAPDDVRELGYRMNLTAGQKLHLPTLPPGRAFVIAPDLPRAIEVQYDYIELGPYPSEERIAARNEPALREFRQSTVFTPEDPIEPLDVDELLGEEAPVTAATASTTAAVTLNGGLLADHLAFLRDVAQFENSGVAARFHRLGFGGSKGNRIKQELIDLGLLEVIEVRKSAVGASTKLLRLTNLAQTLPDL